MVNILSLLCTFFLSAAFVFYPMAPVIAVALTCIAATAGILAVYGSYRERKQRRVRDRILLQITFVLAILGFTQNVAFTAYLEISIGQDTLALSYAMMLLHAILIQTSVWSLAAVNHVLGEEQGYNLATNGFRREDDDESVFIRARASKITAVIYLKASVVLTAISLMLLFYWHGVGTQAATQPLSLTHIVTYLFALLGVGALFIVRGLFVGLMHQYGYLEGYARGAEKAFAPGEKPKNDDDGWIDEHGNPLEIVK